MNRKRDAWFFVTDGNTSSNPKFYESRFISRALGFISDTDPTFNGNSYYTKIKRVVENDFLLKEDVYSVCGLKANFTPINKEFKVSYLGKVGGGIVGKLP